MKKIIPQLLIASILFASCASQKYTMNEDEIKEKGYAVDGWNITMNGKVIGTFNNTEWELYNNKLTREVSVTAKTKITDEEAENLIRFMHTKYPEYKIEVNYDETSWGK